MIEGKKNVATTTHRGGYINDKTEFDRHVAVKATDRLNKLKKWSV